MALPLFGSVVGLADRVFNVIDALVSDKDEANRLKHEIQMTLANHNQAQIAVNQQEAQHRSLFVAGWRPFIGWVCGAALAWEYIGVPIAQWSLIMAGLELQYSVPQIDPSNLLELVLAMLGMAGLRSFEKRTGVAR